MEAVWDLTVTVIGNCTVKADFLRRSGFPTTMIKPWRLFKMGHQASFQTKALVMTSPWESVGHTEDVTLIVNDTIQIKYTVNCKNTGNQLLLIIINTYIIWQYFVLLWKFDLKDTMKKYIHTTTNRIDTKCHDCLETFCLANRMVIHRKRVYNYNMHPLPVYVFTCIYKCQLTVQRPWCLYIIYII